MRCLRVVASVIVILVFAKGFLIEMKLDMFVNTTLVSSEVHDLFEIVYGIRLYTTALSSAAVFRFSFFAAYTYVSAWVRTLVSQRWRHRRRPADDEPFGMAPLEAALRSCINRMSCRAKGPRPLRCFKATNPSVYTVDACRLGIDAVCAKRVGPSGRFWMVLSPLKWPNNRSPLFCCRNIKK